MFERGFTEKLISFFVPISFDSFGQKCAENNVLVDFTNFTAGMEHHDFQRRQVR